MGANMEEFTPTAGETVQQGVEDRAKGLAGRISEIYGNIEKTGGERINRMFAPERTKAVEEEAVLGRLRSPVSAAPDSIIGQVDNRKA